MILHPSKLIERKLPENYLPGELDFCKAEFAYSTKDVELLSFANGYVKFNGYLYDSHYKIVLGSLVDISKHKPTSLFIHYKKLVLKPKRRMARNTIYVLAFDE